jgi:hypothetical protein
MERIHLGGRKAMKEKEMSGAGSEACAGERGNGEKMTPDGLIADKYAWFAKKTFRVRDDLMVKLGDAYPQTIKPVMDGLRQDARQLNISVLKAFERAATPLLKTENPLRLWLLMAAAAELYVLREDLFPGIKRDG